MSHARLWDGTEKNSLPGTPRLRPRELWTVKSTIDVICEALRWDRKKLTPWDPEAKTEGTVNCEINHRCHMRGFEMGPRKTHSLGSSRLRPRELWTVKSTIDVICEALRWERKNSLPGTPRLRPRELWTVKSTIDVICEALRWDRKKLTPWAPEAKTEGTVNCEINHRCHMRGFEMGPKKLTPWDPEAKTEELWTVKSTYRSNIFSIYTSRDIIYHISYIIDTMRGIPKERQIYWDTSLI